MPASLSKTIHHSPFIFGGLGRLFSAESNDMRHEGVRSEWANPQPGKATNPYRLQVTHMSTTMASKRGSSHDGSVTNITWLSEFQHILVSTSFAYRRILCWSILIQIIMLIMARKRVYFAWKPRSELRILEQRYRIWRSKSIWNLI